MSQINQANPLGEDEARSGVTGHNVRYVLAGGLLLTLIGFMLMPAFL
jgi:hypothetical protein